MGLVLLNAFKKSASDWHHYYRQFSQQINLRQLINKKILKKKFWENTDLKTTLYSSFAFSIFFMISAICDSSLTGVLLLPSFRVVTYILAPVSSLQLRLLIYDHPVVQQKLGSLHAKNLFFFGLNFFYFFLGTPLFAIQPWIRLEAISAKMFDANFAVKTLDNLTITTNYYAFLINSSRRGLQNEIEPFN